MVEWLSDQKKELESLKKIHNAMKSKSGKRELGEQIARLEPHIKATEEESIDKIVAAMLGNVETDLAALNKQREQLEKLDQAKVDELKVKVNKEYVDVENRDPQNEYSDLTFGDLATLRLLDPARFKELTVTAVRRSDGKLVICNSEHTPDLAIADAVRSSCSIPLVFQHNRMNVEGQDDLFVDGGFREDIPMMYFEGAKSSYESLDRKPEEVREAMRQNRVLAFAFDNIVGNTAAYNAVHSGGTDKLVDFGGPVGNFFADVVVKSAAGVGGDFKFSHEENRTNLQLRQNAVNTLVLNTWIVDSLDFDRARETAAFQVIKGRLQTRNHLRNIGLGDRDPNLDHKNLILALYEEYARPTIGNLMKDAKYKEKAQEILKFCDDDIWSSKSTKEVLQDLVMKLSTSRSTGELKANTTSINILISFLNNPATPSAVKRDFVLLLGLDKKFLLKQGPYRTEKEQQAAQAEEVASFYQNFRFTNKDFESFINKTQENKPISKQFDGYLRWEPEEIQAISNKMGFGLKDGELTNTILLTKIAEGLNMTLSSEQLAKIRTLNINNYLAPLKDNPEYGLQETFDGMHLFLYECLNFIRPVPSEARATLRKQMFLNPNYGTQRLCKYAILQDDNNCFIDAMDHMNDPFDLRDVLTDLQVFIDNNNDNPEEMERGQRYLNMMIGQVLQKEMSYNDIMSSLYQENQKNAFSIVLQSIMHPAFSAEQRDKVIGDIVNDNITIDILEEMTEEELKAIATLVVQSGKDQASNLLLLLMSQQARLNTISYDEFILEKFLQIENIDVQVAQNNASKLVNFAIWGDVQVRDKIQESLDEINREITKMRKTIEEIDQYVGKESNQGEKRSLEENKIKQSEQLQSLKKEKSILLETLAQTGNKKFLQMADKLWKPLSADDKEMLLENMVQTGQDTFSAFYIYYLQAKGIMEFEKFNAMESRLAQAEYIMEQAQKYGANSIEYMSLKMLYNNMVKLTVPEDVEPIINAVNGLSTNQIAALLQRERKHIGKSINFEEAVGQVPTKDIFLALDFKGMKNFYDAFKEISNDKPELLEDKPKGSKFEQFITDLADAIASVFKKALVTRAKINEAAAAIEKFTALKVDGPAAQDDNKKVGGYSVKGILDKGAGKSIVSAKSRNQRLGEAMNNVPAR